MGRVELRALIKSYGNQLVLKGIDLAIESGEFFSLLGPSGCGKTTTLRLIGGFEENEAGSVLIDGVNIAGVAPERRPVNTVFQNYALFPHMTVADNVGFGLRFQDCTKDERRRRVGEALELVRLGPSTASAVRTSCRVVSSSGSRSRRVLVLCGRGCSCSTSRSVRSTPSCAERCSSSSRSCTDEVGITFVYVTHDQEEALTMSDRLAVMREGTIEQVGPPQDVYDRPESTYVADFLGLANLVPAVGATDGTDRDARPVASRRPSAGFRDPARLRPPRTARGRRSRRRHDPGDVHDVVFVGSTTHVRVAAAGEELEVVLSNDGAAWVPTPGTEVGVVFPDGSLRLLLALTHQPTGHPPATRRPPVVRDG